MNKKVIIIAEAGVNHNGDMNKAIELIQYAAKAGADYVKFQSFTADKIVSKQAKKADYQKINMADGDDNQYKMLKCLELSDNDHKILIDACKKEGIEFLSTAFDTEGIDYLDNLGIPFFKLPSGEITNYPYLKKVAEKGKPVILSTGMANMSEIKEAITVLTTNGISKDNLIVLHCTTEYPTPMEDVNLMAMHHISREFAVKVGYSDHTLGIEVPIAAVALGAIVIEKHFTLDRNLPGPDHKASLEPGELKTMVQAIRNIEIAIHGSGVKELSKSEAKNKGIARKSLHTTKKLIAGHRLEEGDLIPLRPGDGISPMEWPRIIGKSLTADLEAEQMLKISDFQ
jgi:N,N'-diacetyllegionaminate synthase